MRDVDCFGMLYGNRRRLDSVLPPLPKHSLKSTSTEQTFGRLVPMSGVDSFGLLYENRRRLDTVLPPLSCHSKILSLTPPKASSASPSNPERCGELQLPSKLTTFVSRVKKALSRKPQPQKLPEILPCDAKPAPEKVGKPQELCSKGSLAGMPSEGLVVIQIIRSKHQQHGSSEPLLLQGQSKTPFSSSEIAVFPIIKEFMLDWKQSGNKKSSTLDGSQVQGLETTGPRNEAGEAAGGANHSALNEVKGVDTKDDSKGFGRSCSTYSASKASANNSTPGQKIGGGTTNDSGEDGKERSDSSRFDALSSEESAASHTDDGIAANESEEDGRERSDLSKSAASSGKKHVDRRSEDGGPEDQNDRNASDNGGCSTSDALFAKATAVSQPIDGDGSANGVEGKQKDRGGCPISDSLPSKGTLPEVEAGSTAGKDEDDAKDSRDSPNIDAFSQTSSADSSDGGVAVGHCKDGCADGSNRSRPHTLSNEDNAHESDDDDPVEDTKNERKETTDSSSSEYLTADESIQAEDASDEVQVDAETNRILDYESRSLPSEDGESDEEEAVVDGGDDDTIDTSSDKENSSPSILPSSSHIGLLHGFNPAERAPYHNEDTHLPANSSSDSSVDEGPWVMGVDHRGEIQAHRVSPVPFNVGQLRGSGSTPLIESGDSELDDTSPLFQKPSAPGSRLAHLEHAPPSTSGKADGHSSTKASLNVWRDDSCNANPGGKPTLRRKSGMMFKDVSNIRQLLRTVQGTEVHQDPVKENKSLAQTQNNAQRIPYLQNFVPYLQPPLTHLHRENSQYDDDSGEYTWAPGRDPARAAHFTASLAALEGKVFPTPGTPTPLIRCARQEYRPDVLLDWPMQPLYHPKPIRPWLGEKTVKNLEKQVASADRMAPSAEMDPQIGPSTPTPILPHYPRFGTLYSKQKVESSKKQAASPTWTNFFARVKPQIARPMNPSPDAAIYHHMHMDGH